MTTRQIQTWRQRHVLRAKPSNEPPSSAPRIACVAWQSTARVPAPLFRLLRSARGPRGVKAAHHKRGGSSRAGSCNELTVRVSQPGPLLVPGSSQATRGDARPPRPCSFASPANRMRGRWARGCSPRSASVSRASPTSRSWPIECLSVCKRPCTVALAAPGKWTYVVGDLTREAHVEDIVIAARLYAASPDGIVPWRERPLSFRKGVVSRTPPLALPEASLP